MLHNKGPKNQPVAEAGDGADKAPASRAFNSTLEAVLFLLATVVVFAAIGPVAGWWHYEIIQSGSMSPTLRIGGVAVVSPEPVSAVRVGQIIAFHPPGMGDYVRIHRVVSVVDRGGQVWVSTKGDANNTPDPGPVRLVGKTAYSEHYFVPYVGYLGVWLYKHSTRVALEGVLFALMVAGGLFLIWGKHDEEEADEPTVTGRFTRHRHEAKLDPHSAAEKAATATLLSLSHIYAASSEGGETAPGADQPVAKQTTSTRG